MKTRGVCVHVCVRPWPTGATRFVTLANVSVRIFLEANTGHKSTGWQLGELNPSRQRKPSGGENLTLPFSFAPSFALLYLAAVNLLKISGHKFNAAQVDGATTKA